MQQVLGSVEAEHWSESNHVSLYAWQSKLEALNTQTAREKRELAALQEKLTSAASTERIEQLQVLGWLHRVGSLQEHGDDSIEAVVCRMSVDRCCVGGPEPVGMHVCGHAPHMIHCTPSNRGV